MQQSPIPFNYTTRYGLNKTYNFRIGDIVTVKDFGNSYTCWINANHYFTGDERSPFYNINPKHRSERIKFIIKDMALHPYGDSLVCYIQDRMGKGLIIDADGLKLERQYPLREGETRNITLNKKI